jgi:cytoskeleton protein RodZ
MSEDIDASSTPENTETEATEAAPWERLRAAREAAGLAVEEVAGWLKLPVRRLVALEAGDWSAFPSPAYVRPLVASVCRHLKLDPNDYLHDWPSTPGQTQETAYAALPGQRVQGPAPSGPGASRAYRVFLLVCLVLIIAGMAWLLFTDRPAVNLAALPSVQRVLPQTVPLTSEAVPVPPPVAKVASETPALAGQTPAVAPAPTEASAESSPATVHVRATQESWVEIWDDGGTMLLGRLLQPGDELRYNVRPPFEVVLGNAAGVTVDLFDKPFDFSAKTRANVARFRVSQP